MVPISLIRVKVALFVSLLVGRRAVFTSKIRSSPGPTKINHSRGVASHPSPCKISVQCHVVMIFIFPSPRVAFVLISFAAAYEIVMI